ncbi:DUF4329 domain-containing protein [Pseudomonas paraveronii]|uniref:DUF4329 domain-containing protein n=1 Tax=Pseudomonas paraveronii TaxID=3040598 RepID=UPI002AB2F8D3|nr:DUF4329 domain-containing protein [Pseudomonas sp. V3/K/3/5]
MAIRLTREERAAGSRRGATSLPLLSPEFLKEEDAAYWAHTQIGAKRDREYGGVIVRGATGRFLATEPVPGDDREFDLLKVLAVGADGYYQQPKGYTCVASYHSHPAIQAEILQRNPSFDERMAKAFVNFFSASDLFADINEQQFFPAAYLSGPDGSLIRYAPSGSPRERSFALWLRAGKPAGNPVGVYGPFSELVKKVSTLGELSLIVSASLWGGSIGTVPADWVVFEPFTSDAVTRQPLFTSILGSAEEALIAARRYDTTALDARTFGCVLKHLTDELYVATFPVVEHSPSFSAAGLFPERATGKLRLPSNFRLEAIYYRSTVVTADIPERESWLYSTFPTPAEVVAAIVQSAATLELQQESRGLRLYAQTSDGALLELKVPAASDAGALVSTGGDGVLDDNGAQAALKAGSLSPRDYVRRVIGATSVSVVEAGLFWRVVGPLDNHSAVLNGFYQAVLSPPFINAHDAAVYAHEQIGPRRERAYGGYVLKDREGRFFITLPLASDANPFARKLFFPVDIPGPLIPPEFYTLYGRYGSRPALSMVDPGWVKQRNWTREDALINLQIFSPAEIHDVIPAKHPVYLSAAEDCLLAYTPSGSEQEALVSTGAAPQAAGSVLQKRLDRGLLKPAMWVTRLAEAGDLRVIQGNAMWGPRSPIYKDWTPSFEYAPRAGAPDYVTYGALFSTADEAARDLHARVHGRNLPEQAYFAFILKHQDKELYVATEVVGVSERVKLFSLNSVFAPTDDNDYRFPAGFSLCGLFRSQQWQPTGLSPSSAWLTRYFVMPMVLYDVLYESKRRGAKYNSNRNLPVYFSTQEGALLRFVPLPFNVGSGGPVESAFEAAVTELASGQKTAQTFVREWANGGDLRVVRTSQCWDQPGRVPRTWSGYEHLTRRRVGPAFANPDDAARYAAAIVGEGRHRTYGGVLLRLLNNLFVATDPLVVPPQGFELNWIYPDSAIAQGLYPSGSTIVARYRSVLGKETQMLMSATEKAVYQSMVPTGVLSDLLHRQVHIKREYVFGPEGVILSYQLKGSAEEEALKLKLAPLNLVKGDVADNEIERQLRSGALLPVDFVTQVAKAGDLRVVDGNRLWGYPRQLSGPFVPNVDQATALKIKQMFADAPCGPSFTQAYDAVRYAQRLSSPQQQLQFGYVLKDVRKNVYMTTLPLVRAEYWRFEQVFVEGLLPQGYSLDGLYLCASSVAIAPSSDEMALSFFSPQDLVNGVSFVCNLAGNGALPLYLLCADGALLRYSFTKNGRQALDALSTEARTLGPQLLEGTASVADYVRGLATKGQLYVRVPSTVWGKEQAVTAQWQPKAAPWPVQDNPHFLSFCGPLFSHADDAARWAVKQLGGFKGVEYLGAVLASPRGLGFVALEPVEDRRGWLEDTISRLFWFGHLGFDITPEHPLFFYTIQAVQAFYKVIPLRPDLSSLDQRLLDNFADQNDLRLYLGIIRSNRPVAESVYLACRGGALLKYVPGFTADEARLLSVDASPLPSVLVSGLREAGTLSVLDTDAFWTRPGPLGAEWQVKDVLAEPDPQDVLYGRDKDEL